MKYNSDIVKSLIKIKDDLIKKYNLNQSTTAHNHFLSLPELQKDQYIKKYERFWYIFSVNINILNDLLYATKKLEEIKKTEKEYKIDEFETKEQKNKYINQSKNRTQEIKFYYKSFYNGICILLMFIKDNILNGSDGTLKICYPELQYIRLLRNDFIQHVKEAYSFESFCKISIPKNLEEIPYIQIGPSCGGLVFITEYYLKIIKGNDKNFLKNSDDQKIIKNKSDFINIGGWKNINSINNISLLNRIKVFGLPNINQKDLADEFKKIFDSYIFSFLDKKIEEAYKDKILFLDI